MKKDRKVKKSEYGMTLISLVISIIVVVLLGAVAIVTVNSIKGKAEGGKENNNTKPIEMFKENVILEIGDKFDILDLIASLELLGEDYEVKVFVVDEEGNEQEITLTIKYFDAEGNEVSKEDAIEVGEDEVEKLKEGYYKTEYITEVGKYKIVITVKNGKVYETMFEIKDTLPPELVLKEVVVKEGTEINVYDFVESCIDNSGKDCTIYFVDDGGNETEEIPKAVGEYTIRIAAKDHLENMTAIKETKLTIIQKTDKTTQTTQVSSNSSSGSSGSTNVSGYDRSNPIVDRALSLVGETDMSCAEVARRALSAVGLSLRGSEFVGYYNTVTGETIYDEAYIYTTHTIKVTSPIYGNPDGTLSEIRETFYYTENNVIVDVQGGFSPVFDGSLEELQSKWIGKETYRERYYTTSGEDAITLMGTQVSLGSLRPGDFIYYERGTTATSHIAVYIGNGKAVHGGWGKNRDVVIYGVTVPGKGETTGWRVSY